MRIIQTTFSYCCTATNVGNRDRKLHSTKEKVCYPYYLSKSNLNLEQCRCEDQKNSAKVVHFGNPISRLRNRGLFKTNQILQSGAAIIAQFSPKNFISVQNTAKFSPFRVHHLRLTFDHIIRKNIKPACISHTNELFTPKFTQAKITQSYAYNHAIACRQKPGEKTF